MLLTHRMPSSNHLEPEELSEASRIPGESADPTSHTTSPETGDYKPGHQPTATSEQLPSDATDPVLLVPTEEPHILQTRELVTEAPESNPAAEIDAKHSEPSQSKWESVVIEEFPTAALESLGVPWRKVEGEETHIMIGREIMTALRKARAQQPSADMERPMSRVGVTLAEDLDTNAQRTNVGRTVDLWLYSKRRGHYTVLDAQILSRHRRFSSNKNPWPLQSQNYQERQALQGEVLMKKAKIATAAKTTLSIM